MENARPLEVVFLTNFSDYSYRSIPAVAQMADDFALRLTIVHALCNRENAFVEAEAQANVNAFFPEADLYADCERRLIQGDPIEAVQTLQKERPVDLVIAPAADPLGLPRIGHRSLRARLMHQCGVPLWTIGRLTNLDKIRSRARHVACWIDFDGGESLQFAYALEYALKLDASLHILHTLPSTDESLLFAGDTPLTESTVLSELRNRVGWAPVPLRFHLANQSGKRAAARLLQESGADIVFIRDKAHALGGLLSLKPRLLDECTCPVVCVPSNLQTPVWKLERETRRAPAAGLRSVAWEDGRMFSGS